MYENIIDPQIQILERCQVAWDNMMPNLPEDLTPYGTQGLTKSWIRKSFEIIIAKLNHSKVQSPEDINPFLIQSITQNFPSWTSPLESWIASAPSTVPNIASHLNAMFAQFQAHYIAPAEPAKVEFEKLTSENKRLQAEVKELLKLTTNLTKKKDDLTDALTQSKKLSKEFKDLIEEVQKSKVLIETDALVAVTHREGIVSDKAETDAQLKILKAVTEKLPEFEEKRIEVLRQCDEILGKATDNLDATARRGLALSFQEKAKSYVWPRMGWFFLFFASLAGIVGIGYHFIIAHDLPNLEALAKLPNIAGTKISVDTNTDNYTKLINSLKFIPLSLPFVWLAWFSALKFSQLGRLREDYQFKVATALALDGYRKQVAEVEDPKLTEKLLDLAITNFGENPLRLLTKDSAKDAHPLAGIIDEKGWSEVLKEGLQSIANKVGK